MLRIHSLNLGNIELIETNRWLRRKRRVRIGWAIFTFFVNNLQLQTLTFLLFTAAKKLQIDKHYKFRFSFITTDRHTGVVTSYVLLFPRI